jgi:hypothetical protein
MALKLLPDSSITSMVMGNDVFVYAQTYEGDIYQFVGNVENSSEFYSSRRKSNVIIERLKGRNLNPNAPKLFTPIAAVSFTDHLNKPMTERVGNLRHLSAISQADQKLVRLLSRRQEHSP